MRILQISIFSIFLFLPFFALAQDQALEITESPVSQNEELISESVSETPASVPMHEPVLSRTNALDSVDMRIHAEDIPSILFTYWERDAMMEARNSDGLTRAPTDGELLDSGTTQEVVRPKPPPESRYLSLGGIVYVSDKEWTIWLNGKRMTPEALPREAIALKVRKEFIELRWFDEYTNQIYPVRLRPHQRFNLDTRIFLPG